MRHFPKFTGTRAALCGAVLVLALALISYHAPLHAAAIHAVDAFRDAGILPFFAAMAILPAVGFPLSVFLIAAGPIYGPTLGPWHTVAYGMLAMTVNVTLSYWISAYPLRSFSARLAARAGYRLPEVQSQRAWKIILVVRLIPGVPFFAQSYLLGIARVSFGLYLLISLLVEFGYLVSAVLFGAAALNGDRKAMAAAAVLFILIGTTLHILRKTWAVDKPK